MVLAALQHELAIGRARIETATPPLVIDNLSIHGVLRRPGAASAPELDAGLDAFGFCNNQTQLATKP